MGNMFETRRRKSFTLTELMIVVIIIAMLAAVPNPRRFSTPRQVELARTRNQLARLASELDAYKQKRVAYPASLADIGNPGEIRDFYETHTYRPWTFGRRITHFGAYSPHDKIEVWMAALLLLIACGGDIAYAFVKKKPKRWRVVLAYGVMLVIVVPTVSYLSSLQFREGIYRERVSVNPNIGYRTDGKSGFILQSSGSNEIRDVGDLGKIAIDEKTAEALIPYSYDPTNGFASRGDLFQVGVAEKK